MPTTDPEVRSHLSFAVQARRMNNHAYMLTRRSAICWMSGLAMVAFGQGCTSMVVSHRFHPDCAGPVQLATMQDGELAPCDCSNLLGHFLHFAGRTHPLLPGATADGHGGALIGEYPAATRPPPSRFHPVPTRPVFALAGMVPASIPVLPDGGEIVPRPKPQWEAPLIEPEPQLLPAPIRPKPAESSPSP